MLQGLLLDRATASVLVTLRVSCSQNISLLQVMQELREMSIRDHEGLRFPDEAIKHEVDAYVAAAKIGASHPIGVFPQNMEASL